jgi:hypothetical protein
MNPECTVDATREPDAQRATAVATTWSSNPNTVQFKMTMD